MRFGQKFVQEVVSGIRNLMLHKLRSFLTMLGMVFGVSSVIAMLAVGEGASREALDQIRKLGSRNIIIESKKPVEEESATTRQVRMSVYGLTFNDYLRIRETMPGVRQTVPVKMMRQEGQLGSRTLDLRLVGTTPGWFELVRRPILAGRVLEEADMARHSNVAVLTEHGARRLLAGETTIGQSIRIGGVFFEVIGIVKNEHVQGGSVSTPDHETDAYIPLTVARGRFGDIQTIRAAGSFLREMVELHQVLVEVDSDDRVEITATSIDHLLRRFHPKEDYRMSVPLALLRQAEATQRTFSIVLGSIASISLLVGGIGIMNIMLASVTERTREIGIRRALGAKRRQIIHQFLVETVVLSSVGGFIGILLGVLIPGVISRAASMPTVVTPTSLILSLGISMAVGIVFGMYPAVQAAKLDPIVALRHE